MKRHLKKLAVRVLDVAGAYPTAVASEADIGTLIRALRPISPGMDLIRLGPQGDGGYLVPNDLEGIEACFSPGVSDVSGFEEDCANLGMDVFLADSSVDSPGVAHDGFHFTKKYVGATTTETFMTMDEWVRNSKSDTKSDLILQMDIEGFEYETFLSMSSDLMNRCRIIVAEFHRLDLWWSEPFFNLASHALQKILETHACVHVHPNNCCGTSRKRGLEIPVVMEFTFLRRDRLTDDSLATTFPHPLDQDNTDQAHLPLPRVWYGPG